MEFVKSYFLSLAAPAHFVCFLWWWFSRQRLIQFLPSIRPGSRLDETRGFAIIGDMELASSACAMVGVGATLLAVYLQSTGLDIQVPYVGTIFGVAIAVVLAVGERIWRRRISDAVGATQLDDLVAGLASSTTVLANTLAAMHAANSQLDATRTTFSMATEHLRTSAAALAQTLPDTIARLQSAVENLPGLIAEQRLQAATAEHEAATKLAAAASALASSSVLTEKATGYLEKSSTRLADVAEQVHHVMRRLPHEISEQLQRATQPLGETRQILEGVADSMRAAAERLDGASTSIINGSNKTQQGVLDLSRQVGELGHAVAHLKGAGQSFELAAEATKGSVTGLAEHLDSLKRSIEGFDNQLKRRSAADSSQRLAAVSGPVLASDARNSAFGDRNTRGAATGIQFDGPPMTDLRAARPTAPASVHEQNVPAGSRRPPAAVHVVNTLNPSMDASTPNLDASPPTFIARFLKLVGR